MTTRKDEKTLQNDHRRNDVVVRAQNADEIHDLFS